MAKDLSELIIRKLERPGRARVRVHHKELNITEIGEGINRMEAKWRAYSAMARKLGQTGAAVAYLDGAEQAHREYFEKIRIGRDMEFDGEPAPWADDTAFMKAENHGNQ